MTLLDDVIPVPLWHALGLVLIVLCQVAGLLNIVWRFEFTTRRTPLALRATYLVLAAAHLATLWGMLFVPWSLGERALFSAAVLSLGVVMTLMVSTPRWPGVVESSTLPMPLPPAAEAVPAAVERLRP